MSKGKVIGLAAAVPLLLVGAAGMASAQDNIDDAGAAKQCSVVVDRSQAADVFDVTRQELSGGKCVCYVYTGPVTQSVSVEDRIASLQRSRSCPTARVMSMSTRSAGGAANGVPSTSVILPAASMALLGVLVATDNDDKRRPISP